MAILTAHHAVNTRDLPEIAQIGAGDQYGGTSNGNNPGVPGGVDYFGSGNPNYLGLHIKLISLVGDLQLGSGIPFAMTINDIEVFASNVPSPNDPMYEIRGISVQMAHLWADTTDGKVDTIAAEMFQGDDTLNGSDFDDILFAFAGADVVEGGGGDDLIDGGSENDALNGGAGDDEMNGGTGDDDLTGGLGADIQTGGDGADTFYFLSILDSTKKASGRDTILDFDRAEGDEFHLTAIDAKKGNGNQDFKFIKKKDFGDNKGELRYKVKNGDAWVEGDTDGNGKADFVIVVADVTKLKAGDFEL